MALLKNDLSPQSIKQLSSEQLAELAEEIREEIIYTVAKNGGHVASNLGIVELTLALHTSFNMPDDKIIWDVGHQCYPHKLVTGRLDRFHTIRQFEGISGFPKSIESPYDSFDAGHSGTSISAALGMAVQRDLQGKSNKVIAVIGDGSLTNGMALEAMNHAGFMGSDLIVVVNDNERSISKNVGAYSKYLSKLRLELVYQHTKQKVKKSASVENRNKKANKPLSQFKERLKHILTPSRTGAVFQELGFMYLGPMDGHDLELMRDVFESIKDLKGPILVHAITSKGKGYKFAEENSAKFHGIGPFDRKNGKVKNQSGKPSYTSIYGETVTELAKDDPSIVTITAGMRDGTGLTKFAKQFPTRFFDVGIAEEHAVTFGAGLSKGGIKPLVTIYSTFLQRSYDQIIHDVCLQNLPVKFMLDRGGIVGEDGPTHQGVFDLSYLRTIPNMIIMAPKDENEFRHMIKTAVEYNSGPIAIRYPRAEAIGVKQDSDLRELPIGKFEYMSEGEDAVILAIGSTVYPSLEAVEILKKEGLNIGVINARFVKPLDQELLDKTVDQFKYIITVEENILAGGFGSSIAEFIADHDFSDVKMKRIGLPDKFIEQGNPSILREKYKLSAGRIADTTRAFLEEHMSTG